MIEYCRCECHQDINKSHCAPCCTPCRYCGRNIKMGFMETHVKSCITYDSEKEKVSVRRTLKDWLKSQEKEPKNSKDVDNFFSEYNE